MKKFVSRSTAGFTLLEVLIAVVVLSIGLIGLAALMIQGQKFNRSALNRSQATFIGYDMADRMRANSTGDYITATPTDRNCARPSPSTPASICTATQMAEHDRFEWAAVINNVLPGNATGAIIDSGALPAGTEFDITVGWQEADTQGGVATRTYVLRVRP